MYSGAFAVRSVYRARFPGHWLALCGARDGRVEPGGADVEWAAVAVLPDQPRGVVAGGKGADGVAELVDGLADAAIDDLLLQGAEEPLDHAVGLGFSDEGVAWRDAPEADLLLEVVGHEGAGVVVAVNRSGFAGGCNS